MFQAPTAPDVRRQAAWRRRHGRQRGQRPVQWPFGAALAVSLAVTTACAGRMARPASGAPSYAYARAGDTLIVAVSARGLGSHDAARRLADAGRLAAAAERCAAGAVEARGSADPRLADAEGMRWLAAPRLVGVLRCPPPR